METIKCPLNERLPIEPPLAEEETDDSERTLEMEINPNEIK